jgi:hypothetical protein
MNNYDRRQEPLAVRILCRLLAPIALIAVAIALGGCGSGDASGGGGAGSVDPSKCPYNSAGQRDCTALVEAEERKEVKEHPELAAKRAAARAAGVIEEREEKRELSACRKQPKANQPACEARMEENATKRAEERTAATPIGAKVRAEEEAVDKAPAELAAGEKAAEGKLERGEEARGSREYGESQGR